VTIQRAAFILVLAAAAAVVWLALPALAPIPRLWCVALLVALPAWTLFEAKQLRSVDVLPRLPVYITSAVALLILVALTAGAAAVAGFSGQALRLRIPTAVETLLWAAGVTVAGIVFVWICRILGVRESATLAQLLPRTRNERLGFAGLSFAAGLGEEFIYRGFLLSALHIATGSLPLASLLSAAAFGIVHGYQAHQGAARAAVLGMMLTAPVLATGSLLPAMVAHTALDLLLGLVLADRLLASH
jgi:membrane protease YdiL (CAAX protease family)